MIIRPYQFDVLFLGQIGAALSKEYSWPVTIIMSGMLIKKILFFFEIRQKQTRRIRETKNFLGMA
jgi:hypothetical protein